MMTDTSAAQACGARADKLQRSIPPEVRRYRQWLLWRYEPHPEGGKPRKVPYYTNGVKRHGAQGTLADISALATFDEALQALRGGRYDGIGFAILEQSPVKAVDLDNCIRDGRLTPAAEAILNECDSYSEVSPSGSGVRILVYGLLPSKKAHDKYGSDQHLELFGTSGYVTLTGDVLGEPAGVMPMAPAFRDFLLREVGYSEQQAPNGNGADHAEQVDDATIAALRSAMDHMATQADHYQMWIDCGMALKRLGDVGRDLWMEWGRKSPRFDQRQADAKWASFRPSGRIGIGSIFYRASQAGWSSVRFGERVQHAAEEAATYDVLQPLVSWSPRDRDALLTVPPVTWLVEGWIQAGLAGALVAEGGTGKTTVLMHLMCCVATMRPWYGNRVMQCGTSVLLSMDDSQDDLEAALAALLQAGNWSPNEIEMIRLRVRIVSLRGTRGLKTFATQDRGGVVETGFAEQIVEALRGIDDLRLLALDTLRMFSGGDSNDERAMNIATQSQTYIADTLGCAVISNHHTGKAQSRDGVDDMYVGAGSSAIADNLRFILRLKKTSIAEASKCVNLAGVTSMEANILRLSSQRGSIRVKAPEPVFFQREGFRFVEFRAGGTSSDDAARVLLQPYAKAIEMAGWEVKSKRALIDLVGGKRPVKLEEINELVSLGLLVQGNAPYSLRVSDEGRSLLAGGEE